MSSQRSSSSQVYGGLRRELGERQIVRSGANPDTPIAYRHPGGGAVLIYTHDTSIGPMLQIDATVASAADWQNPGLETVLLTEQAAWCFGRAERLGDGIVIEHNLAADAPAAQITSVVIGLADTALRLRNLLARMGALTVLEEAA